MTKIRIYPAIDLRGGNCVRLVKGDFGAETVYNASPGGQAAAFAEAGARYLHVVDLDGARSGRLVNGAAIKEIVAASGLPVQTGGGVRSLADINERLALGVSRAADIEEACGIGCGGVIVGSAIYKGTVDLKKAVAEFDSE